ncbi:MAG: methyltransferase domain-containing protein [Candidatus Mycalebacterium zealandia]|nr:MAG: methyltransferase domain-containing protein [Candidatus Mycalebacterium zealandia]
MSEQESYVYEPFAETEEYKKVNGEIITEWVDLMIDRGTERVDKIVDIATGVGTMVQLFVSKLPEQFNYSEIVCLDQSAEALKRAAEKLEKIVPAMSFINAKIQDAEIEKQSIDVVIWGNGIHYLTQEEQVESLINIRKGMKEGGWLFFNTAFYEGSRPQDTLSFYRTQVKKAVQSLHKRGIKREREHKRAEAASFHPRDHYEELVLSAGFKLVEAKEYAASLSKEAWEYISSFQQYASGALGGYPVEEASIAMRDAVEPAIIEHGREENGTFFVTRNWLSVCASA